MFVDWIIEWILLLKEKNIHSYAKSNALYLSTILFYQKGLKRTLTLLRQRTVIRNNTLKHVKLSGHKALRQNQAVNEPPDSIKVKKLWKPP